MKSTCRLLLIGVAAFVMVFTAAAYVGADSADPQSSTAEAQAPQEEKQPEPERTIEINVGGYIKADAIFSYYSKGRITGVGEDFYIPRTIRTEGDSPHPTFNFHAKESRLWVKTLFPTESGDITTHLEIDFLLGQQGDERVGSSFSPRLRHAYLEWKNLLIGQTWFTFMTPSVIPELLDFVGPSGIVFGRQAQVRYTIPTSYGSWQFALENPETTLTPAGGGARIDADDGSLPDAVVRFNLEGDQGSFSVAVVGRQLAYFSEADNVDTHEFVGAVSFSAKVQVGSRDDLRLQANFGNGLGRYMGLNSYNVGVLTPSNEIDKLPQYGGFVAYWHFWTEDMRSTVEYSISKADKDIPLTGPNEPREFQDGHVNLLWSPTPPLTFGAEYYFAQRKDEGGNGGNLHRVQVSAKYIY